MPKYKCKHFLDSEECTICFPKLRPSQKWKITRATNILYKIRKLYTRLRVKQLNAILALKKALQYYDESDKSRVVQFDLSNLPLPIKERGIVPNVINRCRFHIDRISIKKLCRKYRQKVKKSEREMAAAIEYVPEEEQKDYTKKIVLMFAAMYAGIFVYLRYFTSAPIIYEDDLVLL